MGSGAGSVKVKQRQALYRDYGENSDCRMSLNDSMVRESHISLVMSQQDHAASQKNHQDNNSKLRSKKQQQISNSNAQQAHQQEDHSNKLPFKQVVSPASVASAISDNNNNQSQSNNLMSKERQMQIIK